MTNPTTSIVAFNTLALRGNLAELDALGARSPVDVLLSLAGSMDQLEQSHYSEIVRTRLAIIRKFSKLASEDKERAIQAFVFDHLWLLDPSWERATTNARIEETVRKEFSNIDARLSEDERAGRIDLRFQTAPGAHVIVELKKADVTVDAFDLAKQVNKYREALQKCLKTKFPNEPRTIRCICVLGSAPKAPTDQSEVVRALAAVDAEYITYDELIARTLRIYANYLEVQEKLDPVEQLLQTL